MQSKIAAHLLDVARRLQYMGFEKEASKLETLSGDIEAQSNPPAVRNVPIRTSPESKPKYEFQTKLTRWDRARRWSHNKRIELPNGLELSIQASRDHYCEPRVDNPDPTAYTEYEMAIKSKRHPDAKDYLVVPGTESHSSPYDQNLYIYCPANIVEKIYQKAKTLSPKQVDEMVAKSVQSRKDREEEKSRMLAEIREKTEKNKVVRDWHAESDGEKRWTGKAEDAEYTEQLASYIDGLASRLEKSGCLKEAYELDVVSNTLEAMLGGRFLYASNQEVKQLYEATKEMNPGHAATLVGERKAGSKWGENLTEQKLTSLPWVEYKGPKIPGVMLPFCRYFMLKDAQRHFPGSKQRVETLEDAKKAGHKLQVQKGAHGNFEIVSPNVKEQPVMEAWMVVGPAEGSDGKEIAGKSMIWTLFPGILTGSDPKWDGNIDSIPPDRMKYVAVKGPEVEPEQTKLS